MISEMLKARDGRIRRILARSSGVVSAESLYLCDKNGASGTRDIDGQPERASVWENASQCEELTAIFVTILKRAKTS